MLVVDLPLIVREFWSFGCTHCDIPPIWFRWLNLGLLKWFSWDDQCGLSSGQQSEYLDFGYSLFLCFQFLYGSPHCIFFLFSDSVFFFARKISLCPDDDPISCKGRNAVEASLKNWEEALAVLGSSILCGSLKWV